MLTQSNIQIPFTINGQKFVAIGGYSKKLITGQRILDQAQKNGRGPIIKESDSAFLTARSFQLHKSLKPYRLVMDWIIPGYMNSRSYLAFCNSWERYPFYLEGEYDKQHYLVVHRYS